MKGQFTIVVTAKEAVTLLSQGNLPNGLQKKIVKAFQESNATPIGAKSSHVARPAKKAAKKATTKVAKTSGTEAQAPSFN